MNSLTICVATCKECNKKCKRRHIKVNPYEQSYANFALDWKKEDKCFAFVGFGKYYKNKSLKIN